METPWSDTLNHNSVLKPFKDGMKYHRQQGEANLSNEFSNEPHLSSVPTASGLPSGTTSGPRSISVCGPETFESEVRDRGYPSYNAVECDYKTDDLEALHHLASEYSLWSEHNQRRGNRAGNVLSVVTEEDAAGDLHAQSHQSLKILSGSLLVEKKSGMVPPPSVSPSNLTHDPEDCGTPRIPDYSIRSFVDTGSFSPCSEAEHDDVNRRSRNHKFLNKSTGGDETLGSDIESPILISAAELSHHSDNSSEQSDNSSEGSYDSDRDSETSHVNRKHPNSDLITTSSDLSSQSVCCNHGGYRVKAERNLPHEDKLSALSPNYKEEQRWRKDSDITTGRTSRDVNYKNGKPLNNDVNPVISGFTQPSYLSYGRKAVALHIHAPRNTNIVNGCRILVVPSDLPKVATKLIQAATQIELADSLPYIFTACPVNPKDVVVVEYMNFSKRYQVTPVSDCTIDAHCHCRVFLSGAILSAVLRNETTADLVPQTLVRNVKEDVLTLHLPLSLIGADVPPPLDAEDALDSLTKLGNRASVLHDEPWVTISIIRVSPSDSGETTSGDKIDETPKRLLFGPGYDDSSRQTCTDTRRPCIRSPDVAESARAFSAGPSDYPQAAASLPKPPLFRSRRIANLGDLANRGSRPTPRRSNESLRFPSYGKNVVCREAGCGCKNPIVPVMDSARRQMSARIPSHGSQKQRSCFNEILPAAERPCRSYGDAPSPRTPWHQFEQQPPETEWYPSSPASKRGNNSWRQTRDPSLEMASNLPTSGHHTNTRSDNDQGKAGNHPLQNGYLNQGVRMSPGSPESYFTPFPAKSQRTIESQQHRLVNTNFSKGAVRELRPKMYSKESLQEAEDHHKLLHGINNDGEERYSKALLRKGSRISRRRRFQPQMQCGPIVPGFRIQLTSRYPRAKYSGLSHEASSSTITEGNTAEHSCRQHGTVNERRGMSRQYDDGEMHGVDRLALYHGLPSTLRTGHHRGPGSMPVATKVIKDYDVSSQPTLRGEPESLLAYTAPYWIPAPKFPSLFPPASLTTWARFFTQCWTLLHDVWLQARRNSNEGILYPVAACFSTIVGWLLEWLLEMMRILCLRNSASKKRATRRRAPIRMLFSWFLGCVEAVLVTFLVRQVKHNDQRTRKQPSEVCEGIETDEGHSVERGASATYLSDDYPANQTFASLEDATEGCPRHEGARTTFQRMWVADSSPDTQARMHCLDCRNAKGGRHFADYYIEKYAPAAHAVELKTVHSKLAGHYRRYPNSTPRVPTITTTDTASPGRKSVLNSHNEHLFIDHTVMP